MSCVVFTVKELYHYNDIKQFYNFTVHLHFLPGWDTPNWFTTPNDSSPYQPSFHRTNWFEPVKKECELVLNKVGLIDLSPFGKIEIKGQDASKFVDYVYANKTPKVLVPLY